MDRSNTKKKGKKGTKFSLMQCWMHFARLLKGGPVEVHWRLWCLKVVGTLQERLEPLPIMLGLITQIGLGMSKGGTPKSPNRPVETYFLICLMRTICSQSWRNISDCFSQTKNYVDQVKGQVSCQIQVTPFPLFQRQPGPFILSVTVCKGRNTKFSTLCNKRFTINNRIIYNQQNICCESHNLYIVLRFHILSLTVFLHTHPSLCPRLSSLSLSLSPGIFYSLRMVSSRESELVERKKGSVAEREIDDGDEKKEEMESVEMTFKETEVPSWRQQLTIRAFIVSFILSVLFSFIVMKLNLTTGIIPSLNVSAGLLGFFFVKTWTKILERARLLRQPFTRQENTVIQTCVVASSGIAFSGGFGSYLFGMSEVVAKQSAEENYAGNFKNPSVGWMIGFLFIVSFLGLFSVLPLRKIMVVDFKLIYPSGTATAHLINSFHTPQGASLAKKQVKALGKFFSFSFLWGMFQWFFAAADGCGFSSFPTFGLKAFDHKFYFDFSATYVGVGMICPYIINISLLVGAVLSWGVMWPLIDTKKGVWYDADLKPSSLHGLQGYKVFIAIFLILGDGLYNLVKVLSRTLIGLYSQLCNKDSVLPVLDKPDFSEETKETLSYDDQIRTKLFLKDQIPNWVAISGYVGIAAISIGVLPHVFPPLKWYYILIIYIFAPVLAFCNAYGCGLTDWSLASTYGKLAIFIIGAWAGAAHGGVLAGLAACGVMMNIVSTASDLMQDFKTGYMTLASPRSMFVSQIVGTAMGCVISPCVFWLFYTAYPGFGTPDSEYQAPYALVYRNISLLGVQGFSSLPKNCLLLCLVFFAGAIVVNGIRDLVPRKVSAYIPLPMAMAIPFYLGSYFAIDMCLGSLILFLWTKSNKAQAEAYAPAVASGLICGDGIWTLPSSLLALLGVKAPICMKFLSRSQNDKVDAFLAS